MLLHIILELSGLIIVLLAVREVLTDIFLPLQSGSVSRAISRACSLSFRTTSLNTSSGPLAIILIILSWVFLLAIGFTFIYVGLFPRYFISQTHEYASGALPQFLQCFYFSLGSLGTFQTFDLVPKSSWLKLVVAAEGLIGISLITASVSWLVLLYPALERTRRFSLRMAALSEAEELADVSLIDALPIPTLIEVAQAVLQLQLDLVLFPILLDFRAAGSKAALTPAIRTAIRLSSEGFRHEASQQMRLAAAQLQSALNLFSFYISKEVLRLPEHDLDCVVSKLEAFE